MTRVIWLRESLEQLEEIANLPDNWDDEGAPPTNPDIVKVAKKLLEEIAKEFDGKVAPPGICAVRGGGFQFEWRAGLKYLELEFRDEYTIGWLTGVHKADDIKLEREDLEAGEYDIKEIQKTINFIDWLIT